MSSVTDLHITYIKMKGIIHLIHFPSFLFRGCDFLKFQYIITHNVNFCNSFCKCNKVNFKKVACIL